MAEELFLDFKHVAHVAKGRIVIALAQHLAQLIDDLAVYAAEDIFQASDLIEQGWQDPLLFQVSGNQELESAMRRLDGLSPFSSTAPLITTFSPAASFRISPDMIR